MELVTRQFFCFSVIFNSGIEELDSSASHDNLLILAKLRFVLARINESEHNFRTNSCFPNLDDI